MGAATDPRRIGVFGGTFDPPHVGHLRVAGDVAERLALDRVLWIPARVSPFKQLSEAAAPEARLEMVREAVRGDARFQVDERELHRPGPSFTVDTLEELRRDHPEAELFLILGADQFADFPKWRRPDRIVELARLAVMNRAGTSPRPVASEVAAAVPGLTDAVVFVPVTDVDVSSTQVRTTVAAGGDSSSLVPDGVARVMRARGLYAD